MSHFVGTGLSCALSECVVHHRAELCTMVHRGDLCPWEVGVAPDISRFWWNMQRTNGHSVSVFGGVQEHTIHMVFLCLTINGQINVDSVVLYQHTLW